MKKIFMRTILFALMLTTLSFSAFAFSPRDGDIYWFLGYNVASKLSVITEVPTGIKLDFKYDGQMWANRTEFEFPFQLDKPEGISVKLRNITWPAKSGSIALCISQVQGGWSDSRSLIFWIVNSETKGVEAATNGWIRGLSGYAGDETTDKTIGFLDATPLTSPIKGSIDFSFKKKNATQWAININGQEIIVRNTSVTSRFTTMKPIYLNFGTWQSTCAVSYVVTDVNYSGAFGSITTAAATTKAATTTAAAGTTIAAVTTTVSETTVAGETTTAAETTTIANATTATTPVNGTTDKSNDNSLLWIIIAIIVVLGGAGAYYFLYYKKKNLTK